MTERLSIRDLMLTSWKNARGDYSKVKHLYLKGPNYTSLGWVINQSDIQPESLLVFSAWPDNWRDDTAKLPDFPKDCHPSLKVLETDDEKVAAWICSKVALKEVRLML